MSKMTALELFKKADLQDYLKPALIGAGVGGLGMGAASFMNHQEGETPKDRAKRILTSSLTGVGLGGVAGAGYQAAKEQWFSPGSAAQTAKSNIEKAKEVISKKFPGTDTESVSTKPYGERNWIRGPIKDMEQAGQESGVLPTILGAGGGIFGAKKTWENVGKNRSLWEPRMAGLDAESLQRDPALQSMLSPKTTNGIFDSVYGPNAVGDKSLFDKVVKSVKGKGGKFRDVETKEIRPAVAGFFNRPENQGLPKALAQAQQIDLSGLKGQNRIDSFQDWVSELPKEFHTTDAVRHLGNAAGVTSEVDGPAALRWAERYGRMNDVTLPGALKNVYSKPIRFGTALKGLGRYTPKAGAGVAAGLGLDWGLHQAAKTMSGAGETEQQKIMDLFTSGRPGATDQFLQQ